MLLMLATTKRSLSWCRPQRRHSNPAAATKMARNSIGCRVPVFYTGSSGFESLRANKRMNSSMAEQVFVKHQVKGHDEAKLDVVPPVAAAFESFFIRSSL
jgi:hypothetical protein